MQSIRKFWRILCVASMSLLTISPALAAGSDCQPADMMNYVTGESECLALKTYLPSTEAPIKTLVIVLHGDLSGGGGAEYIFPFAEKAADAGATGVAMMRLGYYGAGRTSTGTASRQERRDGVYTSDEMDAIADATRRLKEHYGAERVVMIGHSGGSVMTGVILGRHPGLVQRALLISCPCDIPVWRRLRGRKPLLSAENPAEYLDRIPADTVIRLVTGTRDTNTFPSLARDYAAAGQARGLDAVALEVDGAGHNINDSFAASEELRSAFDFIVSGD